MFKLFKNNQHKHYLLNAFSNCFKTLKDELGNVPVGMQTSHEITGAILGSCRGYAITNKIDENSFDLIVDGVFEEVFRRESIPVQTKTEKWLQTEDETFMFAYYHAKSRSVKSKTIDLSWLAEYAKKHFKAGHQVMFDII
jgi:hypothetical protein